MAPSSKANYKTYEAQARLVRAIVAAHPDVKWNYKETVACFGSDMTEDALNHRFRRFRAESVIVQQGLSQGFDMKNLPVSDTHPRTIKDVDVKNISKYFGQSTADGIQFQFRGIKKDAELIRKVEGHGGNVANCLPSLGSGSGPSTPVKTPSKSWGSAKRSGSGIVRKTPKSFIKKENSEFDGDDDDDDGIDSSQDYSSKDVDETPSKRAKRELPIQKNGTPSRRAATKAAATITNVAQQFEAESDEELSTQSRRGPASGSPTPPFSIFGNPMSGAKTEVEARPGLDLDINGDNDFDFTSYPMGYGGIDNGDGEI